MLQIISSYKIDKNLEIYIASIISSFKRWKKKVYTFNILSKISL